MKDKKEELLLFSFNETTHLPLQFYFFKQINTIGAVPQRTVESGFHQTNCNLVKDFYKDICEFNEKEIPNERT